MEKSWHKVYKKCHYLRDSSNLHVRSNRSSNRRKVPALKSSFKEKQQKKLIMKAMKDHEKQLKENAAQEKQVQLRTSNFY